MGNRGGGTGPRMAAALALFFCLYFLFNLNRSFWIANEGYYSLGARSVLEGAWLVPTIHAGGEVDKPPLAFWWVAAISAPFGGVREWTAWLANSIPALLALVAIWNFGSRKLGPATGWLALFATGLCSGYWEISRQVSTDSLLTAILALAWTQMFGLLTEPFRRSRWTGFWILVGLGMLTKGPVALALSGLAAVIFSVGAFGLREGWRRLWGLRPITGVLLCLAPFACWAGAVYLRHGGETFYMLVVKHNFIRFVDAEEVNHPKRWWYFFKDGPVLTMPWTALLPFAGVWLWKRRAAMGEPERLPIVYSLAICAAVFGFFSLSSSKRDYYLLPLVPWLCLVVAHYVAEPLSAPGLTMTRVRDFLSIRRDKPGWRRTAAAKGLAAFSLCYFLAYSLVATPLYLEKKNSPKIIGQALADSMGEGERLIVLEEEDARILFYLPAAYDFYDDDYDGLVALKGRLAGQDRLAVLVEDGNKHDILKMNLDLYLKREVRFHDDTYYILLNHGGAGSTPFTRKGDASSNPALRRLDGAA